MSAVSVAAPSEVMPMPTFAPAPPSCTPYFYIAFPGATSSSRLAGILGGGEIGYNYQMGPWVLGLEGDFVWTNARSSKACGNLVSGFAGFSAQCIVQFDLS